MEDLSCDHNFAKLVAQDIFVSLAIKGQVYFLESHLSSGDGPAGDAHYEVRPEGVQGLQQDEQHVKHPPRRVRPDDLPALKHSGV